MEHLRILRTSTRTFHNNRRTKDSRRSMVKRNMVQGQRTTRPPAPPLPKVPAAIPAPALATPKAPEVKATTHQQQQQARQLTGSAVRHREKKPVEQPLAQQQQPMKQQTYPGTAVPGPKDTPATANYRIKEGQYNTGRESMYNNGLNFTFHNKQWTVQMSQSYCHNDNQSLNQHQQEDTGLILDNKDLSNNELCMDRFNKL